MKFKFSLNNFSSNIVIRSLNILAVPDRIKVIFLVIIQITLSLLDLAGVAVIGMIGAMTINGSSSRPSGDRVNTVLNFLQIDNFGLAKQVAILGLIAATLLIGKTISTIYLTRRTMMMKKLGMKIVDRDQSNSGDRLNRRDACLGNADFHLHRQVSLSKLGFLSTSSRILELTLVFQVMLYRIFQNNKFRPT